MRTRRSWPRWLARQPARAPCSRISGDERAAAARGGGLLVPRRVGGAQGAGAGRVRRGRPAAAAFRAGKSLPRAHWGVARCSGRRRRCIAAAARAELVQFYAVPYSRASSRRPWVAPGSTAASGRSARQRREHARRGARRPGAGPQHDPARLDRRALGVGAVALYLWRAWVARGRPGGVIGDEDRAPTHPAPST